MNSENQTETEDSQEIKIIPYQSYRKIHSTAPSQPPQTTRPFRRGEKRLATLTSSWKNNVATEIITDTDNQLEILRNIENQPNAPFLKSLITRKLKSYTEQDAKKQFDIHSIAQPSTITVPETIQLLVESQLKCYYCHQTTRFFYETVRDPLQWTLERLNNEYPHTKENVVVACLQCNLRRRCINSERYQKTKQIIQIQKMDTES